jgi:hypothetical protein
MEFIEQKNSIFKDYDGNVLTLNKNGSVGYCFYQSTPFIKTCDVIVLSSIEYISKYAYIYILQKLLHLIVQRIIHIPLKSTIIDLKI